MDIINNKNGNDNWDNGLNSETKHGLESTSDTVSDKKRSLAYIKKMQQKMMGWRPSINRWYR